jgi:hypothetical protein
MSEILEILLQVAFNVIGCVLEAMADAWFPDFACDDTKTSRIILGVVIISLAAIIFWELR